MKQYHTAVIRNGGRSFEISVNTAKDLPLQKIGKRFYNADDARKWAKANAETVIDYSPR